MHKAAERIGWPEGPLALHTGSELPIPLLFFSRWDKSLAHTMQFVADSTCPSPSGEAVPDDGTRAQRQRWRKAPSFRLLSQP